MAKIKHSRVTAGSVEDVSNRRLMRSITAAWWLSTDPDRMRPWTADWSNSS